MLQLPYQFGRSGMDRLNIPLGSLVLTFLCGIHSRSALGITSSSGGNSSQNPTTSPTSLPPTLSRTSIETEWFHVLSSIGYSFPFVSLSPIPEMLCQHPFSLANQSLLMAITAFAVKSQPVFSLRR
ncbi:unnamed protein product [Lactuca virosa]|uniref:Cytochrome c biogenesis B n=1 Tax=Lactuca virosa TaxID=75947 RepID=A0AAU9PUT5_9ASTR|nr:unnamed protein product [Lactuca virosa]